MDKNAMVGAIKKLLANIGGTFLSKDCGMYYYILFNGEDVFVKSPRRIYGDKLTDIDRLCETTITLIYNDLKKYFCD